MRPAEQDPLELAASWHQAGEEVALATVVRSWGSSPRPPGSRMVVTRSGRMAGSVSGGCVEGEVTLLAIGIMDTGVPALARFDVSSERAWAVGLACGGVLEVFIETLAPQQWSGGVDHGRAMTPELLRALCAERAGRRPCVLATRLGDGAQRLLTAPFLTARTGTPGAIEEAARQVLARGRAETVAIDGAPHFLDPHLPPARLLIVGAVHVAQSLAPLASLAGIAPVVIDPRGHFATEERFPGIDLVREWPDGAIEALAPDGSTAIASLTHDPKLDDPALEKALEGPAFYIGTLGSTRTHAARLARLAEKGHDAAVLSRLRGPIGLAIGARTPEEIAVSILAEIVAVRRGAALGAPREARR